MLSPGKGGSAPVYGHGLGKTVYERHQPEQRLIYQLVEAHFPALVEQLAQRFQTDWVTLSRHREQADRA